MFSPATTAGRPVATAWQPLLPVGALVTGDRGWMPRTVVDPEATPGEVEAAWRAATSAEREGILTELGLAIWWEEEQLRDIEAPKNAGCSTTLALASSLLAERERQRWPRQGRQRSQEEVTPGQRGAERLRESRSPCLIGSRPSSERRQDSAQP